MTTVSLNTTQILTAREVAAYYRTTSKTVLDWNHAGRIPAEAATGKVFRFDLEKVRAALAQDARSGRATETLPPAESSASPETVA